MKPPPKMSRKKRRNCFFFFSLIKHTTCEWRAVTKKKFFSAKMKKRKAVFALDDIDEQLLKKQKEEVGSPPEQDSDAKPKPKHNSNAARSNIKRNKQHLFSVITDAELENPETTVIANPMSTLYEFNTVHALSNKKSTKDLSEQSKSERETLLMKELAQMKTKELSNGTGQKYKKKMDPERGRFSRHDTIENDDKVKEFFKTEEEAEQEKLKMDLSSFSQYEEDNILFKHLEQEERRRDESYREDARDNAASMHRKLVEDEEDNEDATSYFAQPNSKILLEEVNVAYCAQFLREPLFAFERNCKQESNCVAKIMYVQHPDSVEDTMASREMICREFLLPSQKEKFDRLKQLPVYRQACLLCKRLLTTYTYKKNEKENREPLEIIQDHYNTVGVENGGYPLDACLHPVANKNQKSGSKVTGIARPFRRFSAVDYVPSTEKLLDENGQVVEVRCFIETPLNFPIAPVVDIAITRQNPSIATTAKPRLA